jgi:predicted O-methyltransferase YrrM
MHDVEGWFFDEEADLLIAAATTVLSRPGPHALVEIGSYCGRSTVVLGAVVKGLNADARVYAIDPHEGEIGAADVGLQQTDSTHDRFRRNIARAGVDDVVTLIRQRSYETTWESPIALLLVDGLHDRLNVSRDFRHFEPNLSQEALIAFHDYSQHFPGVVSFVDELTSSGSYERVQLAGSLHVLAASISTAPHP